MIPVIMTGHFIRFFVGMNDRIDFLKKKAQRLPLQPGVYIMKNKAG